MANGKTAKKQKVSRAPRKPGFLGFETNTFDRYFISVVLAIAMGLAYLRFLEPLGVPSLFSWLAVVGVGYVVVTRG